jgi:hypothetical protein
MGDTYDSGADAEADRAQQKRLLAALNASERALRRDECGAWAIGGKHGSISTWGDGDTWALFVACRSAQHWTWTKKKLSFCMVTQDGDDEGCLRLHRLPTPSQATLIRNVVGIQKRRQVSEAELDRLRAFAFERKPRSEATLEPKVDQALSSLPDVPQEKNANFQRGARQMKRATV